MSGVSNGGGGARGGGGGGLELGQYSGTGVGTLLL